MSNSEESRSNFVGRFWKWIWPDNLGNVAAIGIALVAALLGLFDILVVQKLIAVTLTILALMGYSLVRDRV